MTNVRQKLSAAILFTSVSIEAAAQEAPNIQEAINRGSQIDDVVHQRQEPQPTRSVDIDDEAGIYVVTLNEIFYVSASAGAGWSENPLRNSDDEGSSTFMTAALSSGVQTRINQSFDAGLALSVSGTQFQKAFAPSSRAVTMTANIGDQISDSPLYTVLYGYGGYNFDENFGQSSSFYGATAAINAALTINPRVAIRPGLSLSRQFNEIEENDSWKGAVSLDTTFFINNQLRMGLSARLTRTIFDDFFEDVTFVKRKDLSYNAGANLHYRPMDWLTVAAFIGYERLESTFELSEFNGWETGLNVSVDKRF